MSECSNDSLIVDMEETNFTEALENMKGGPYERKVEEYIKTNFLTAPNHKSELTDLAANKTGYIVHRDYKNFVYK